MEATIKAKESLQLGSLVAEDPPMVSSRVARFFLTQYTKTG
jgi:hypothetical protein